MNITCEIAALIFIEMHLLRNFYDRAIFTFMVCFSIYRAGKLNYFDKNRGCFLKELTTHLQPWAKSLLTHRKRPMFMA